jgi:phytoene dehydrogenase-like protein
LVQAGCDVRLLESADAVGGRIRTDRVDGFLLDRGFQVFLTAYPAAQAELNYDELKLRRFQPGALVRFNGRFQRLSDPWRSPEHLVATALSPVATLADKLRIASFRRHTSQGSLDDLYHRPAQSTLELLRERGFSSVAIERFFRPFLGGIFLDPDLATSSRMCEFVFRMFAQGDAALPAECIRTESPVERLDAGQVVMATGERLSASAIVIATEAPTTKKLLGEPSQSDWRRVDCHYFAARDTPLDESILLLNGDGTGPINNVCVPSQLSRKYAPDGQSLVSVTVLDRPGAASLDTVQSQLVDWFGPSAANWRHLKSYAIPQALPNQTPPALQPVIQPAVVRDGIFVCGDHCDTASINGALASGKRAAQAVREFLS